MREWLVVIIILLIVGILLDGLRRMRRARRQGLRMSRKARKLDAEDFPESGSEICSGPRVVSHRDKRDAEMLTKAMRQSFANSRITAGAPAGRIPEQVTLNLQESVPMLMDSVEETTGTHGRSAQPKKRDFTQPPSWAEPKPEEQDDLGEDEIAPVADWDEDEPSLGSLDDLTKVEEEEPKPETALSKRTRQAKATSDKSASRNRSEPAEVLIVNLMAPAGQHFEGSALLQALLDEGLRFGAMNIFHRHKDADGSGPVWFSLANMVVPGTFDLSTMKEFSTPGVSMFLSLPSEDDSLAAFDCMAETARALAKTLGGELKDENRSVMTRQTLEHCRQRVIEFERKQRLMKHS